MDELDHNLLAAWERVRERVARDPAERWRRVRRLTTSSYQAHPRAWCLAVRASDTRINQDHCAIWPVDVLTPSEIAELRRQAGLQDLGDEDAETSEGRILLPGAARARLAPVIAEARECDAMEAAFQAHHPHAVTLREADLRRLCAPVRLPREGMHWKEAARLLGMHEENLRSWMKRGALEVWHERMSFKESRWKPVQFVSALGPIDPSGNLGKGPDAVFGTLWQSMHQRIPAGFEQTVVRVPRFRPYGRKGREADPHAVGSLSSPTSVGLGEGERGAARRASYRFRGWTFICPRCEVMTEKLYLPVPTWTVGKFLGEDPLGVPPEGVKDPDASASQSDVSASGLGAGVSLDALASRGSAAVRRGGGLACHRCHRIAYFSLFSRNGWNQFVLHISGGVLGGKDVAKPAGLKAVRKRQYVPHRRNGSRAAEAG